MNRHRLRSLRQGLFFKCLTILLGCRWLLQLRRFFMRWLPFIPLQSRVKNIVYLSWLVDIEQVRQHYPQYIPLWEKQGKTIFTILTYQHQHFGFRFLGKLRRFMPSPQQSNWRFYLNETHPKTVIFEQVIVDQYLYVLGGRLASDVMPAQYAAVFQHGQDEQQRIQTDIFVDTTYHLQSTIQPMAEKQLPASWQALFKSWGDAVHFLVDQDHAWAEWLDQPQRLSQGDIEMPIQYQQIQAVEIVTLKKPELLKQFAVSEDTEVFAFIVPDLDFHVIGERILPKFP